MKPKSLLPLFYLVFSIGFAQLQNKYPNNYSDKNYKQLKYGFFQPNERSKKCPLLIYLHGYQATKAYDFSWYQEYFQKETPCYVLTPKSLGGPPKTAWGNSLMESLTPDFKTTIELIKEIIKNYNIDEDRIYLYGTSMGADGVFVALAEYPNMFAAATAICGYGSSKKASKHSQVPLWMFHGENDNVTPVDFSRKIYNQIQKNPNHKTRYTEYRCIGHDSWNEVNKETTVNTWLFSQVRNKKFKKPKTVKQPTLLIGDRYWKRHIKWEVPKDYGYLKNKVWHYNLYKNGKLITQTDKLEYLDIDISKKTSSFYVTVVNFYGEESAPSKTLIIN